MRYFSLILLLLLACGHASAAVLPEERADLLYHSYEGGGATIDGPAVLVRKSFGDSVSVGLNHYVDNVTSATIDVEVSGASEYTENREENSISFDYLRDKTTISFGYGTSIENDYDATSYSLGISQDMFGDLTTVAISFAFGDNIVSDSTDDNFEEENESRRYRLSLSQILTKNFVMAIALETITDEGFLNNPYRFVRIVSGSTYTLDDELYPNTRTSNALAVRGNYFLEQRAALSGGVRVFSDNWGIDATTLEIGYTMPYGDDWIFEASARFYSQSDAEFYSDLLPFAGSQTYFARDKELSEFDSTTIGVGAVWEFGRAWQAIERGSLGINLDYNQFDYDNFRDQTQDGPLGAEPLYEFDATVIRALATIWF